MTSSPSTACVSSGAKYRAFKRRARNFLAGKTDKSGSSLADAWDDNDMGGAGPLAPPMPGGGAGGATNWQREMISLRTSRRKLLWAWVIRHLLDKDTQEILSAAPYWQDHLASLVYLDGLYDTPIRTTELRKMNKEWDELNIIDDVGINAASVTSYLKLLMRVNGERPFPQRYGNDAVAASAGGHHGRVVALFRGCY